MRCRTIQPVRRLRPAMRAGVDDSSQVWEMDCSALKIRLSRITRHPQLDLSSAQVIIWSQIKGHCSLSEQPVIFARRQSKLCAPLLTCGPQGPLALREAPTAFGLLNEHVVQLVSGRQNKLTEEKLIEPGAFPINECATFEVKCYIFDCSPPVYQSIMHLSFAYYLS